MRIDGAQIGFLAEDMDKVLPEVVGKDSAGKPANIDYAKRTSMLSKAIQQIWQDMQPVIARGAGREKSLDAHQQQMDTLHQELDAFAAECDKKEGKFF